MSAKAKLAACSILALLAVGTVWTATQAESEAKRDESVGLLESLDEPIRAVDGVPEPRVGDVTRLAAGGSDSLVSTDEVHASAAPVEPGPGTLLVRVVDSGSRPIANALVFLKSNVTETVPTDADGLATFAVPPGTEVAACARHVDYRFDTANVTTSDDAATPTDLTIVLEKHLTACVRVESKDGAPIEGATVEFRELETQGVGLLGLSVQGPALRERSIAREYFKGQFQEARTSERDGTCCVAGLMPGPLAVSAEADGFVRVASLPFDVGEEGGDLGIVRLEAAREVPGIVLDDAGPVPDALVESHVSAHAYVHTRTDADGRFVLQGVQPDLMHLVLRVSHESRGDYYNASEPITASGLTVLLRPTLHATLRLFDASTRQPVDKPCFVTPLMPRNELSIYVVLQVAGRRELSPVSGEVRVDDVHYFGLGLRVEVPGYSRVDVDTATIAEAAGEPIDLYVQWQGNISVRALDALTGKAVSGAKVIVANVVAGAHGPLNSWRTIAADYDDAAGAYVVDASVFNMLSGQDEALVIAADGYAWSAQLPVIRNGVRVAGPSMEIQLDRE